MAADLAREFRVVVVCASRFAPDFEAVPGVHVIRRRSGAEMRAATRQWEISEEDARARAAHIEALLGLRLYKAAGNFLLCGRVVRDFGGYWKYPSAEKDLLMAFIDAYEVLSPIFDNFHPDVVFYEAADLISNNVALALAVQRKIFAFEPRPSPLGSGSGSLAYGLHRTNIILNYLLANPEKIDPGRVTEAEEILARPRDSLYETFWSKTHRGLVRGHSPFNPRWWVDRLRDPDHALRGLRNARWHLRGMRNRPWLNRNLLRTVPRRPYIAFLLNHLPEASTSSQAPRWIAQDYIVEQLAVNAPVGLDIVVKEHPRTFGRRGKEYFGRLSKLPSVQLCHPAVGNFGLLSGAEAILSVTGTSGFEGIVLGKRVAVLGRPFYSSFSGVRRLEHPDEIFDALEDPTWEAEQAEPKRVEFLAAYLQSLFHYGVGSGISFYPPQAGKGWATAVRETLAFIDRHQLSPLAFDAGLSFRGALSGAGGVALSS